MATTITRQLPEARKTHQKVENFLDSLQAGGFWNEHCAQCRRVFQAPNGEELCPRCSEDC